MQAEDIHIRPLLLEEAEYIYNAYMKQDFPQDELKPFGMISAGVQAGTYVCLGGFHDEELIGYAFLVYGPDDESQRHILLDYFAVPEELRGRGYGTALLPAVREFLLTTGNVLIEIEDSDFAEDAVQADLMLRRQIFYLNAGARLSDVRSTVYGVHYRILYLLPHENSEIPKLTGLNADRPISSDIETQLTDIYRSIFPSVWWEDGRAQVYRI